MTDQDNRVVLAIGGQSRFHSVKNGLEYVRHQSIVFVHDGVRCLVSGNLIHSCYEAALKNGNAIPAIHSVDSIRVETDHGSQVVDRQKVRIIQTPQTFYSDILKAGYEQPFEEIFTDEASIVERLGIKIHLIKGQETNIKITRPLDIIIAEKILEEYRFI